MRAPRILESLEENFLGIKQTTIRLGIYFSIRKKIGF